MMAARRQAALKMWWTAGGQTVQHTVFLYGAGRAAWWTSSGGDVVQRIELQALGSRRRRSRTPVRLKWREAGQGVDAIFTNFEPRLFLPNAYLPTSCCQDHQDASRQHPYQPIIARLRILDHIYRHQKI
jgi:hypothetical protein